MHWEYWKMDINALLEIPHYTGIRQGPLLSQVGQISMPLQSQKNHSSMDGKTSFYAMVWYIFKGYGKGCFSLPLRHMLFFKHQSNLRTRYTPFWWGVSSELLLVNNNSLNSLYLIYWFDNVPGKIQGCLCLQAVQGNNEEQSKSPDCFRGLPVGNPWLVNIPGWQHG